MLHHLSEVIVYVSDMSEAVDFYRDRLGLSVLYPSCADFSREMWVVLDTGPCKVCLHGGAAKGPRQYGAKPVFGVTDIHSARESLIAKGVKLSEVRSPAPGIFVCDSNDPFGNPFSIEASSHA
jgi:predicted enzyme related to lactoylglutathione lyase